MGVGDINEGVGGEGTVLEEENKSGRVGLKRRRCQVKRGDEENQIKRGGVESTWGKGSEGEG